LSVRVEACAMTRQQWLALFLVILMFGSSIVYALASV
jgi:hypothetical protein